MGDMREGEGRDSLSVDRKFGGERCRFDMAAYYKFPWTEVDVVVAATNRLCDTTR